MLPNTGELCHICSDTGLCPAIDLSLGDRDRITGFCDCDIGITLRQAAQINPINCPICRGRGNLRIGGMSPNEPPCPHVHRKTYEIIQPR